MESAAGKILRNKITKQQGRVVRIAEYDGDMCYIVFITRDPARRTAMGPEALWRDEEVEAVPTPEVEGGKKASGFAGPAASFNQNSLAQ
jgi:hypothetical protein